MIYDIGYDYHYHYHLGGHHHDYIDICSLPFVGDHRVAQPWHVQWLGNIAAFYLVTCTGLGRYLYRPIAHSYCRGDAGNRQHVVPRAVAALFVTAILSGAVRRLGRANANARWCVMMGVSDHRG